MTREEAMRNIEEVANFLDNRGMSGAAGPRWKVFCLGEECGGCVDTGYAQQRHHVTEKWNRRAGE